MWNKKIRRKIFFSSRLFGNNNEFGGIGDKIIGHFDRDFFPDFSASIYTELPKELFLRETSNLFSLQKHHIQGRSIIQLILTTPVR